MFYDANKRTAVSSMLTFLTINDYELNIIEDELADKTIELSESKINGYEFSKNLL